jgi:Mg-chelatase subunit ChlD
MDTGAAGTVTRSPPPPPTSAAQAMMRWRLILGRMSEGRLGRSLLGGDGLRIDAALGYLYDRELAQRGLGGERGGSLDPSQLTALRWLGEVRELFPAEAYETIQGHALERYGMKELLTDPQVLERLEPNLELLKSLLALNGGANPQVAQQVRAIARKVVDDIMRRLRSSVERMLSGRRNRFEASPHKVMRNFDWRGTIRRNLKTYDPARQQMLPERLRFFSRVRRRLPWTVILCIDQSGSMAGSIIHSAVMAAIIAGLPSLRLHLVVFDTAVVDLTDRAADPVDVLLSVRLGGGTDIGAAVGYCEQLIVHPPRTVLVLVTDFYEGASPMRLVRSVARLAEARVKLLGLAALDEAAAPCYDRGLAGQLAEQGMQIGAMTPARFAEWLAAAIK